jgi:hypothetical protein
MAGFTYPQGSLVMRQTRNGLNGGDPVTSESLKAPFLRLVGRDYTSVACKRLDLPYPKIQAWLNGSNTLPDALQAAVKACIEKAAP